MNNSIDFPKIAQTALYSIDALLNQWLPGGRREGGEYKALNPTRSDSKLGSFSINLRTGAWADFATGDKGGDLISLYAYIHGLEQLIAARELADTLGIDIGREDPVHAEPAVPEKPAGKTRSAWAPLHPVPDDAGAPPVAHYKRGRYQHRWAYLDQNGKLNGYICLYKKSDGSKETLPITFCVNAETGEREWRWMAFAEPRPLYGLDRLASDPTKPVLLVEGEKCADIAVALLVEFAIVSWAGGGKAVDKTDWSPLYGRTIYAWPDCDAQREQLSKSQKEHGVDPRTMPVLPQSKQPGTLAMLRIAEILREQAPGATDFFLVKIPAAGTKESGWDIADAVAEGMDAAALTDFIRNARDLEDDAALVPEGEAAESWNSGGLLVKNHEIVACLANVFRILTNDAAFKGLLAYNSFAYQVMKLRPPPYANGTAGEWDDQDDAQTTIWISEKYRFSPTVSLVAEAVETVAKCASFHPVQDYLKSLKWDGTERLDNWITDYTGAPKTDYTWRVARWFLMGMVARAMEPGVKFDHCIVLEGQQGRMKSAALRVLGGQWFSDTDLDLHNKDSMSAIRGKWLHEFAELGSLARSEAAKQKSFLSRQVDEFRPVYGRREIRSPRQLVFAGTTNDWEWNKDPSGARRFWPIECKQEIDIKGMAAMRDQLFAEAMVRYLTGEKFWPSGEEQRTIFEDVQMRRNAPETMVDLIHDWVIERYESFSMADVAMHCLKLDASKMTRDLTSRIGSALHTLGCKKVRKVTRATTDGKAIRRAWYLPPQRKDEPEEEVVRTPGEDDEPINY